MNRHFISQDGTLFVQLDTIMAVIALDNGDYALCINGIEEQYKISYAHTIELNNALVDYYDQVTESRMNMTVDGGAMLPMMELMGVESNFDDDGMFPPPPGFLGDEENV